MHQKESAYYADSKCIRFIKCNVGHQKLRAWDNLPDFWNKGKYPIRVEES